VSAVRSSRRVSRRALSSVLIGAALILAGTTAQAGWLFVLAAGVLGVVFGSFVLLPRLRGAEVSRELPRRVRLGEKVPVVLRVTNRSKSTLPVMRVEDSLEAFEPVALCCKELGAGVTARVETVRRARQRGVYESGPVCLQTSAPLSFARRLLVRETPGRVTVVPSWVELPAWSPLRSSGIGGEDPNARAGQGTGDYLGVRDYRPGDPMRAVHWRTAARAGRLIVTEFEEESRRRVLIALGGPDAGIPPDSAFETLARAAASIAKCALDNGHQVSLLHSGGELADARFGDCLEALAEATPDDRPLCARLGSGLARLGRGGTVVLLACDSEQTRSDLEEATRLAASRHCRTVAVIAESGSWLKQRGPRRSTTVPGATTRMVWRNANLRTCLGA
jgi:uncharacterized protein (DUF58 family)